MLDDQSDCLSSASSEGGPAAAFFANSSDSASSVASSVAIEAAASPRLTSDSHLDHIKKECRSEGLVLMLLTTRLDNANENEDEALLTRWEKAALADRGSDRMWRHCWGDTATALALLPDGRATPCPVSQIGAWLSLPDPYSRIATTCQARALPFALRPGEAVVLRKAGSREEDSFGEHRSLVVEEAVFAEVTQSDAGGLALCCPHRVCLLKRPDLWQLALSKFVKGCALCSATSE